MATESVTLLFAICLGIAVSLPFPYLPKSKCSTIKDDFNTIPFSKTIKPTFHWREYSGKFNSTGEAFTAYVGLLSNPDYFSIKLPQEGKEWIIS